MYESLTKHISQIYPATLLGALISIFFFEFSFGSHDILENIRLSGYAGLFGTSIGILSVNKFNSPASVQKFKYLVFLGLRIALAILIFKHAIDQVHGAEFNMSYYSKEGKIVDYSSKQFFWLFHAYNPVYQKIFGWFLMAGAIGLCFRFTTLLACFTLLPIFIHILVMNYMFDVGLKLDSVIIIASLLGILSYYRKYVYRFFLNEPLATPVTYPFLNANSKTYKSITILKMIFIIGYITLLNHETFDKLNTWWRIESPIIQGVWQIDTIRSTTDTIPRFEKFFFEEGRRGIATVENDTMSGFQYIIDTTYNQLEFWNFHVYRDLDFKGKYELLTCLLYTSPSPRDS